MSQPFTSCKKTTNVDVEISTSGKLTYKLLDDAGKGMANVKVSIFSVPDNYYSGNMLLDTKLTDANGLADFGALNPNDYFIVADSAKVNNIAYNVREYVQVITGGIKNKEVKVTDFSGTFNLTVKTNYTNQPIKGVGVAMIPIEKFNAAMNALQQLKYAEISGVTDLNGMASIKIPSDKAYSVYLYNPVKNISYDTYTIDVMVNKDGVATRTMQVYQP